MKDRAQDNKQDKRQKGLNGSKIEPCLVDAFTPWHSILANFWLMHLILGIQYLQMKYLQHRITNHFYIRWNYNAFFMNTFGL